MWQPPSPLLEPLRQLGRSAGSRRVQCPVRRPTTRERAHQHTCSAARGDRRRVRSERGQRRQRNPAEVRLASGRFEGRAGHGGSGGAALYRVGGAIELRFDSDFTVSNVPGPAIFLTSRADMGGSIDAQADIKLGTLTAFNGAQRIAVPAGAELGRRNVFIYCQPFRVEIVRRR